MALSSGFTWQENPESQARGFRHDWLGGQWSPWTEEGYRLGKMDFQRAVMPIIGAEQEAYMPGGFLSDVSTQRAYSSVAPGFLRQQGMQDQARMDALGQAGLNPMYARERAATDPYRGMRELLGLRSGLEGQLAERRYASDQGVAGALSQAAMAEIQAKWQKYMIKKMEKQSDKALGIDIFSNLLSSSATAAAAFA